jgi:hypothetical protein
VPWAGESSWTLHNLLLAHLWYDLLESFSTSLTGILPVMHGTAEARSRCLNAVSRHGKYLVCYIEIYLIDSIHYDRRHNHF